MQCWPIQIRWSTLASSETIPEVRAAARTLLFRVAERTYGCDIAAVREIIPYRRATRLPGAPAHVQGLINLRGTIVTVLDLGVRLDATRPMVRDGSIILATHGARVVGVAVDEVLDVQAITEEQMGAAGGAVDAPRGLVRGLGQLGDDVVIVVDIQALVTQVLL
ncbi:MAG: cheW [Gemmatimonadetes bacterium]|nr:cheW [Gemmatimonadota bacterium]